MNTSTTSSMPAGRHQRKLKNLLLDKKFQLKYTGYLLAIATIIGTSLGYILWRTSTEVVAQSARNAVQGEKILELGQEVVAESRKVSAVVRMNIVKDPVYQDDPDLLAAFNAEAKQQDQKFDAQRDRLAREHRALEEHALSLKASQRRMFWAISGALIMLILAIGAAGIVVTHKVAGPIFKMKRHLKDVARGKLEVPWGLRRGDELVDFFDAFRKMVASLRQQREEELAVLKKAVDDLSGQTEEDSLAPIKRLISDLERSLE